MKTPSDDLFLFIKSLQPQEKAYFKQYLGLREEGKIRIRILFLFDSINKMAIYEEGKIKTEAGKMFGMSIYDFAKLKNSLSSILLTCLVEYHAKTSSRIPLNQILSEVEVLIQKNLFGKAYTIIKKAKTLAAQSERFDYLQMFIELEQIIETAINSQSAQTNTQDRNRERLELLEKEKNWLIHKINRDEIYSYYVKYAKASQPADVKFIRNALSKMDRLPKPMTFKAEKQLLNSKVLACFLINDYPGNYKYSKQFVELYEKKGQVLIFTDLRNYIVGLTSLLSSQQLMSKFNELEKTYLKAKRIYTKIPSKNRTSQIDNIYFSLDVAYIESQLAQLKFNKVIEYGEAACEKYLKNNLVETHGLMHLYFFIAKSYFCFGNYKQSLKWFNKLLLFERDNKNPLIIIAKMVQLIIHYELKNNDLVVSISNSLLKKLKKSNKITTF
jgi:hypothetical protein